MGHVLTCLLLALSTCLAAAVPGQRWLDHFNQDLLPFWDVPAAWGAPRGNFPTFRCNDGRLFDPAGPCPELEDAPGWIKGSVGTEYTRMKSRQTYFYCVAYHLTGRPELLALARDGVAWIRTHALDTDTGSAISYWEKGAPGPEVLARTSQDLAYAQLGMAMYYYLTRDPAVLADLVRLKNHIFQAYWDKDQGLLRWVVKGSAEETGRVELVAQLDQINAYLLLLAPILPEPLRSEWQGDLVRLARIMVQRFHAPERHLFWGTLHEPRQLGTRHTDFGHTAKALWMIGRIGQLTGDRELTRFAALEAPRVLDLARLPDGTWGSRLRPDGSMETFKEWWIYAELDQLAETLALTDARWSKGLDATAAFWLESMVDHQHHEVWGGVAGKGDTPSGLPKIHQWKSGYHSAEHALVGFLTSRALEGKPATLYFALGDPKATVRPYVFEGRAGKARATPLPGFAGLWKTEVPFTDLR